jgi:ParB-like chromosome segregation protein Spo0J
MGTREPLEIATELVLALSTLAEHERIDAINRVRALIHSVSPLRAEPIDLVEWVPCDNVQANDWNPNSVAPVELRLLEHSIKCDGYTQPIVTNPEADGFEVVDGFHRNRVGKESAEVRARVLGYLPIVRIKADRTGRPDRIASTIRHNRARGVHRVDGMSAIVQELTRRNWSDEKIAKELGMDADEVLRLKQITGLAELFADREFSEAWEPVD